MVDVARLPSHSGRSTAARTGSGEAESVDRALAEFDRHRIGILLQQLSRDFERRVRSALRARGHTGLQPSHQVVFAGLRRSGSRLTELARSAGMSKQAMGQIVDDLERLGYVAREPDPRDGRAKLVRFTARGFEFVRDAAEVLAGIWRQYAACLGPGELDRLQDDLGALLERAGEGDGQA